LTQLIITLLSSAWFVASVAAKQASSITHQLSEHTVEFVGTTAAAQSTTISLSVSETVITEGDEVTVSGAIEPPDEVSITLLYTVPDGSTLTRNVTSSSDGSFSDSFIPTVTGSWSVKASWTGSETQAGATSSTESFTVLEAEIWGETENGDGLDFWKVWEPIPSWMLIIVAVVAIVIFIGIILLAIRKK
jgi:cobalamin biosynthesis Mg chelatase CobN